MSSLTTYLRNVRAELDHVAWPRPRTAIMHVVLIALITIVTALIIAGLDYVFTHGIEYVLNSR